MIELRCVDEQIALRLAPILEGHINQLVLLLLHNHPSRKFK